jgi:GT2 family glycosyltransferase
MTGAPVGPVTVAVTNFNGAAFIDDCLAAVAELEGDVVEVIVVDNASTDDSTARIRRHDGIRLVELETNAGPCPARNRALELAGTEWVLQIDSDVIVRPGTLVDLWPQTAEERVVAVQPRAVLAHDPSVVHYEGGRMHYVGIMCLDRLLVQDTGIPAQPEDVDAVISMALLLRRAPVLEIGGYDEAFFILFEDHDLSYRLRARGWRLRRVPAATVLHREGTRGISYRPGAPDYPARRAYLHARNRPYLVLKNYSLSALVLSFPGRCVYALAWLVFAARQGVLGPYLRGRLDLLRLLPRALARRGDMARSRRLGDAELLVAEDLTVSPVVPRRHLEARLERTLSRVLRAWWRSVRWLVR